MTGAAPRITWIRRGDPPDSFPPIESAFVEPDGLLAAGGDLSCERLIFAYRHGIFPWYNEGQTILWWSPDPRCVIAPADLHVSRRMKRSLAKSDFRVSFNRAFADVIKACAAPRAGQDGTWIGPAMRDAYCRLHKQGWAHSCEVWQHDRLVGGIYGLAIGKAFFGESMFCTQTNASKVAMLALCHELRKRQFAILDCQVVSPHLLSLGATTMPRKAFAELLESACVAETQRTMPGALPTSIADYLRDMSI